MAIGRRHRERPAGTVTVRRRGDAYDPIIGAAQVQSNYNVNGSGMTVAVIDTGIDYNNPALGGASARARRSIAGYDFSDNSGQSRSADRRSQHGTARRRPDRLEQPQ